MQAVNKQGDFLSYADLIVEDCRLLLEEIHDCYLVFAKRSTNQDAHSLARRLALYLTLLRLFL